MKRITWAMCLLFVLASPRGAALAGPGSGVEQEMLVRALRAELKRMGGLHLKGALAPYHVAYRVVDVERVASEAEFGGELAREQRRSRRLTVRVRVGSARDDNANFVAMRGLSMPSALPLDDDLYALRRAIWRRTDTVYKYAVQALQKKRAVLAGRKQGEVEFVAQKATRTVQPAAAPSLPGLDACAALTRPLSELAWEFPHIDEMVVRVRAWRTVTTFVDSEGSLARQSRLLVRLDVEVEARAEDGTDFDVPMTLVAPDLKALPALPVLKQRVRQLLQQITALRKAPVLESYSGPVLFEGQAAAQLLHHLLVPQLSGTPGLWNFRGKQVSGSALAPRMGRSVLPAGFSLVDDPTLKQAHKVALVGGYLADDEGAPARRVELVRGGKLQGLLMTRTHGKGHKAGSTGHGRADIMGPIRASSSNLVLRGRGLSHRKLRRKLQAMAQKAGEKGGLIVRQLELPRAGGPRSFFAMLFGWKRPAPAPLLVYRLGPGGKEELVRWLKLSQVQLSALRQVVAGKSPAVLNYTRGGGPASLGADRGTPASLVTPSLLLPQVELTEKKVRRMPKSHLPRPGRARGP